MTVDRTKGEVIICENDIVINVGSNCGNEIAHKSFDKVEALVIVTEVLLDLIYLFI